MKKVKLIFGIVGILLIIRICLGIYTKYAPPYKYSAMLITAINNNDIQRAEEILDEYDWDINAPEFRPGLEIMFEIDPHLPLARACAKANYQMVKLLLEHGASVERKYDVDFPSMTAVLLKYDEEDLDIVKLLYDYGVAAEYASLDEKYDLIRDAVTLVCLGDCEIEGHDDPDKEEKDIWSVAEYILEQDDIFSEKTSENGDTLLYYTLASPNYYRINKIVDEYKPDLRNQDVLWRAIAFLDFEDERDVRIFDMLYEAGMDIYSLNDEGQNALQWAEAKGRTALVKKLRLLDERDFFRREHH